MLKYSQVAVEGCCHGELDEIYKEIENLEKKNKYKVDLLLICGDFQAVRNFRDLQCMAVPDKYKALQTFHKFASSFTLSHCLLRRSQILYRSKEGSHSYSDNWWKSRGVQLLPRAVSPLRFSLSVLLKSPQISRWMGCAQHLLPWPRGMCPGQRNPYSWRIGNLQRIQLPCWYTSHRIIYATQISNETPGLHETIPYTPNTIRSIYHIREYSVRRLSLVRPQTD